MLYLSHVRQSNELLQLYSKHERRMAKLKVKTLPYIHVISNKIFTSCDWSLLTAVL